MAKPRIMFYHDGRHAGLYRYEPPIGKSEYVACVDELVGTPIEALMFCLGEGRTMLHDTRAGELLGHNISKWDQLVFRRAYQNAKHLIDQGNDPLRIVCDRAHEKGLLVYPTLLVQRGGAKDTPDRCSNFRKQHPHLEIGAAGDLDPDYPGFTALDLKHQEARDERFAIVQEVVTDYPVDGFELHLNHMPWFFHPDQVAAGRTIMTDWIGKVHEAVKRTGKDRELLIRIPDRIDEALAVGLDVHRWVRDQIVDVLVAEPFNDIYFTDPMADYGQLVQMVEGSNCRLLATIHSLVDTDRLSDVSIAMVRAMACNSWAQGVDGLYLSEWYNTWPYEAPFYEKLRELPHPDIMGPKDKSYFVPTMRGRSGTRGRSVLPADLPLRQPLTVPFRITDDLPRWDADGRVHEVLLRLRALGATEADELAFSLNGKPLPDRLLRKINDLYKMTSPRFRVMGGYWYVFRLDREHWPVAGENRLEVTLLHRVADVTTGCRLHDVEVDIRYLLGKHFHRGYVDADLGPYEHVNT